MLANIFTVQKDGRLISSTALDCHHIDELHGDPGGCTHMDGNNVCGERDCSIQESWKPNGLYIRRFQVLTTLVGSRLECFNRSWDFLCVCNYECITM